MTGIPPGMTLIRARQHYGFRNGYWARLRAVMMLPGLPGGDRECYAVQFPDGVIDFWATGATEYGYEFLMGQAGQRP